MTNGMLSKCGHFPGLSKLPDYTQQGDKHLQPAMFGREARYPSEVPGVCCKWLHLFGSQGHNNLDMAWNITLLGILMNEVVFAGLTKQQVYETIQQNVKRSNDKIHQAQDGKGLGGQLCCWRCVETQNSEGKQGN